jgi:hypothetical protein
MDVEDVDPVCLEFLEGVTKGDVQGTLVVSGTVNRRKAFASAEAMVVCEWLALATVKPSTICPYWTCTW